MKEKRSPVSAKIVEARERKYEGRQEVTTSLLFGFVRRMFSDSQHSFSPEVNRALYKDGAGKLERSE